MSTGPRPPSPTNVVRPCTRRARLRAGRPGRCRWPPVARSALCCIPVASSMISDARGFGHRDVGRPAGLRTRLEFPGPVPGVRLLGVRAVLLRCEEIRPAGDPAGSADRARHPARSLPARTAPPPLPEVAGPLLQFALHPRSVAGGRQSADPEGGAAAPFLDGDHARLLRFRRGSARGSGGCRRGGPPDTRRCAPGQPAVPARAGIRRGCCRRRGFRGRRPRTTSRPG